MSDDRPNVSPATRFLEQQVSRDATEALTFAKKHFNRSAADQSNGEDGIVGRWARREPLLLLLTRLQRGLLLDEEKNTLRAAVEAELSDAEAAHAENARLQEELDRVQLELFELEDKVKQAGRALGFYPPTT